MCLEESRSIDLIHALTHTQREFMDTDNSYSILRFSVTSYPGPLKSPSTSGLVAFNCRLLSPLMHEESRRAWADCLAFPMPERTTAIAPSRNPDWSPPCLPFLPEEVIDHILGFLSTDTDTLRACSTVARSWLPLAQRYIFRDVKISLTDPRVTSQPFRKLLRLLNTTSPHLGQYTRHLRLMVVLREEWWTTSDVEQKLCDLLRYLEQPRSAQIMLYSPCWTPNIVHSLQSLVSRPTFESLFLTSLGKLVDGDYAPVVNILTHCTYVRHLKLAIQTRFQRPVFKGACPTINLPGLQTLTLCSFYPETYTLHTPNIQALSFHICLSSCRELDTAAWSLVPRMPLSVTKLTLELVVDTPQRSSDEFPSFGDYDNNVEHLTLIAQLDLMVRIHDRVLDAIDSLFSAARQKNLLGLRTVSFKFNIPCNFEIALRTLQPNATWASLDAHFNMLLRSGRLESLLFDFHFSDRLGNLPNSQQDRSLRMSEFMEDCLPHVSRSGIIKIKALESP